MAYGAKLVPLADLPSSEMEFLLDVQAAEWRGTLLWDFQRIAQGLLFLADLRAHNGFALVNREGRAVGYAAYVLHEGRAAFSDFYLAPSSRCIEANTRLLGHVLTHLDPGIKGLRMAPSIPHQIEMNALTIVPSEHMCIAEAAPVSHVGPVYKGSKSNEVVAVRPWDEVYEEEAAELIPSAYSGDDPSRIDGFNRSAAAARDFLDEIIHVQPNFPFLREASVLAIHRESGRLCGLLLASHAMQGVSYANFLCVAPWAAAYRLGNRLCEAYRLALKERGYHTITLRRSTTDPRLNRFYGRWGFVKQCDLPVYVWEPA